jgi:acyl carrier protein
MNEAQLKDVILNVLGTIAPDADLDSLGMDDNIRETLDIDSFDHLNFLIGLHDKLGVDIPEADYGKLNTMRQVINYLLVVKA